MYETDESAFEKLKNSDSKAFEWLFKNHYQRLCLFANRYVNNLPVAEEIVAETFTFLWERRGTLIITSSFTSYIYRAIQNRCLNYIKHKKVENAYVDYLVRHNLLDDQDYQDRIINSYSDKELATEIRDAINKLPGKCREIFTLSRFGDLSYKQIAAKLSISPKTVENQMGIALDKLRQVLKDFLYLFF